MPCHLTTAIRNTILQAIVDAAGSGATLTLYSGAQVAAGASPTSNTDLAVLTFGSSLTAANGGSAGSISGGVLTLGGITQDSSANRDGTALWARLAASGGTWVADFSVSATGGGGDITMPTNVVTSGLPVTMSGTNTITAGNV